MRLTLSLSLCLLTFACFQGGAAQSQEKDKDKKTEPGVKEINEIGGKTVDQWVKEMVQSKDRSRAEVAIKAITAFPQAKALTALDALLDELDLAGGKLDANNRLAAISAVGAIIGQNPEKVTPGKLTRAMNVLKRCLGDGQYMVRMRAMSAFADIGAPAESHVNEMLTDMNALARTDVQQRVAIINAVAMILAKTPPAKRTQTVLDRAVGVIGVNTDHSQMIVRINALNALQLLGPSANAAVPKIITQLHEQKTWEVRQMAALALGTAGFDAMFQNAKSKLAHEALIGALKDPCSQVRLAAIRGLETHGVPHVVVKAKDPKMPPEFVAKPFIKDKDKVIVELDKVAYADPEPGLQIAANLAVMKLTKSVPAQNLQQLAAMMRNDDPGVRGQATQAIGFIGKKAKDAVSSIVAGPLNDKEPAVVMLGIWSLSCMEKDANSALPALQRIVADKEAKEPIKKAAERAIEIIEGKKKDTKDTSKTSK